MSIFATAVRCNVCRDTHKVTIENQLYWCEFCCPAEVAGAETTPEEELPAPQPGAQRKTGLPGVATALNYNAVTSAVFTPITSPAPIITTDTIPTLEDGTPDPRYCQSCASQNVVVRATVVENQFHHWDLIEPDGEEDYYNYIIMESSYYDSSHLDTHEQVFYCRDCGNTSSISSDIEYD